MGELVETLNLRTGVIEPLDRALDEDDTLPRYIALDTLKDRNPYLYGIIERLRTSERPAEVEALTQRFRAHLGLAEH